MCCSSIPARWRKRAVAHNVPLLQVLFTLRPFGVFTSSSSSSSSSSTSSSSSSFPDSSSTFDCFLSHPSQLQAAQGGHTIYRRLKPVIALSVSPCAFPCPISAMPLDASPKRFPEGPPVLSWCIYLVPPERGLLSVSSLDLCISRQSFPVRSIRSPTRG